MYYNKVFRCIMLEPMNARDLFAYAALVVFGGLYLFSAALLLAESCKRDKRKRQGKG
jgi:hypothetical protein